MLRVILYALLDVLQVASGRCHAAATWHFPTSSGCRRYAKFADPESPSFSPHELQAVEAMFAAFGDFLSIAYIQD